MHADTVSTKVKDSCDVWQQVDENDTKGIIVHLPKKFKLKQNQFNYCS